MEAEAMAAATVSTGTMDSTATFMGTASS